VVAETLNKDGSTEVDAKLAEIEVTFGKEMTNDSWSWSTVSEDTFPKIDGKPKYLADKKTCVLPVKLEAGKTYTIWQIVLAIAVLALVRWLVVRWIRNRCPACGAQMRVVGYQSVYARGWLRAYRMPVYKCRSCRHMRIPPGSVAFGEKPVY